MEPLKRPLPDVIMRPRTVRDPGIKRPVCRENQEVQQPQMVEKYHRTPKMNQATVEP